MNIEIVTIGNELLIGQILDRNSHWMAQKLSEIGLNIIRITSIPDEKEDVIESIQQSFARAQLVLMTGGLGPTKDDITKKTLCDFFHTRLIFNEKVYADIEQFFRKRGIAVSEINRSQAELPENCEPIHNAYGTAPGMWFKKDEKILVSMPGVPYEMKAMMENHVIPRLKNEFQLPVLYKKTILTTGIPESVLSDLIEDWENDLPKNIKIAYLPSPAIVRLRISGRGDYIENIKQKVENKIDELKKIIHPYIFGYDDDKLEEILGKMLLERKKTLSTAESCTGGNIAKMITSVSGSSAYFKGAVVAYSNEIKEKQLHVDHETIMQQGAVSEEVVKTMARNMTAIYKTDYSIAVSGIDGPTGGTPDKPIGTVWIAISDGHNTLAKKYQLGDNRERNIFKSSVIGLNMLRLHIINHEK